MAQVGFEPMFLVFEGAKTVHALDRAATVISSGECNTYNVIYCYIPLRGTLYT
jgi:hypothetical protein